MSGQLGAADILGAFIAGFVLSALSGLIAAALGRE